MWGQTVGAGGELDYGRQGRKNWDNCNRINKNLKNVKNIKNGQRTCMDTSPKRTYRLTIDIWKIISVTLIIREIKLKP